MTHSADLALLLSELDALFGVSGYEGGVGDRIAAELEPYVDESRRDCLGNRFFVKRGTDPEFRLMLSAHMDEVGLIVSHIDEAGFVYCVSAGLLDARALATREYLIQTSSGPIPAIVGSKPAHLLCEEEARRVTAAEDLYFDLGCSSRAEVEGLGVRVGDPVGYDRVGRTLNGRVYSGKSVDNRAGCAVLVEVMRRLSTKTLVPSVHAVATVQEELGIRGAGPAAARVDPRVAVAIDAIFAGGTPDLCERKVPIRLGAGPAIKLHDWSPCNAFVGNTVPRFMTDRLIAAAERAKVPYQREVVLNGGTDGWAISMSGTGVLTGCVSIPARYIHTAVGCVHLDDLENAVSLIVAFIEDLDASYGLE